MKDPRSDQERLKRLQAARQVLRVQTAHLVLPLAPSLSEHPKVPRFPDRRRSFAGFWCLGRHFREMNVLSSIFQHPPHREPRLQFRASWKRGQRPFGVPLTHRRGRIASLSLIPRGTLASMNRNRDSKIGNRAPQNRECSRRGAVQDLQSSRDQNDSQRRNEVPHVQKNSWSKKSSDWNKNR